MNAIETAKNNLDHAEHNHRELCKEAQTGKANSFTVYEELEASASWLNLCEMELKLCQLQLVVEEARKDHVPKHQAFLKACAEDSERKEMDAEAAAYLKTIK